jgi:antitoxin component of MazEF toxin-antitoxin module
MKATLKGRMKTIRLRTGKICKMGAYSVGVIVPKVWLENTGLHLGDSVIVEMEDDALIIRPAKKE